MKVQVDPNYQGLEFTARTRSRFFVDKTMMLGRIFDFIAEGERYTCVSRPPKFGKSTVATMIAAFFGPDDSSELFDQLAISQHPGYAKYLNSSHVIFLNLTPNRKGISVDEFLDELEAVLHRKLRKHFPEVDIPDSFSVIEHLQEIYEETGQQFLFVLDDWNSILQERPITPDRRRYLGFIAALLKEQDYVKYAYLTGVLPIAVDDTDSGLTMVKDHTVVKDDDFATVFGFTEDEVDKLFKIYQDSTDGDHFFRDHFDWEYKGYHCGDGPVLYNPFSVCSAFMENEIGAYWVNSSQHNFYHFVQYQPPKFIRDIAYLLGGLKIDFKIDFQTVLQERWLTREAIMTAMLVYGFATTKPDDNLNAEKLLAFPNAEIVKKLTSDAQKYRF